MFDPEKFEDAIERARKRRKAERRLEQDMPDLPDLTPDHGIREPDFNVVHLTELIDVVELNGLHTTYRGRMKLNSFLFDDRLTCPGCRERITDVLSHGFEEAYLS